MTIDECIRILNDARREFSGGTEITFGAGFGNGGSLESVSLQVETDDDENVVLFEEPYLG